ncbi:30S ribosomal protein S20 [Fundicoccus culcitae]|uniref:Small ribosomal subunit protein bS20 n=1 Tax=Fundicoccus culcitae TaxID=2969821 RepID=A0ABY5P6L7_9LACT|nr:30S ribosomal protein S20 [Fundicoccus culcitae]UUX34068.1 30S ribosomal protein S20 [Fundicoccus culcitae]
MANNPSAIKRIRQTATKTEHNRNHISKMRTSIKNYRKAVETGEGDAQALLRSAISELDSAATKGLIHKNKAQRDKSRLTHLLNTQKA